MSLFHLNFKVMAFNFPNFIKSNEINVTFCVLSSPHLHPIIVHMITFSITLSTSVECSLN